MILRDYQKQAIALLREKVRSGYKRIIMHMPTGSGKTATFCSIAYKLKSNKKKVVIIMRRRELVLQTRDRFKRHGLVGAKNQVDFVSTIMSGEKDFYPNCPVQICSIDTLYRRDIDFLLKFDYVIVDEAHDTTSDQYRDLLSRFRDSIWLGFTATPFRTGNRGLTLWETAICPIKTKELIAQKYLVRPVIYAPKVINTKDIPKAGADFNQKKLFERLNDSKIVGDIVDTWINFSYGKQTILFAVNKAHAKLMAEAFNREGIPAEAKDESDSSEERKAAIERLKKGETKILCNVNIFSTGVDIPSVQTLILARPTHSYNLFIQQIGRGLRKNARKSECLILDHAGNCYRHGYPTEHRDAELTDKKKEAKKVENDIKIRTCPQCYGVIPGHLKACMYCDFEFIPNMREIRTESGDLELVTIEKVADVSIAEMRKQLNMFKFLSMKYNWKPNAMWFKLIDRYGDAAIKNADKLGMPKWVAQQNIKS